MGMWGKICKQILEDEIGMSNILCLDNYNFNNQTIFPFNRKENWDNDTLYIIAAKDEKICQELGEQCKKYVESSQIERLFSFAAIPQLCNMYGHTHLDFLCVGFQKCGTSSLQEMLIGHPDIFLPKVKETFFAHHIYSPTAHENLQKVYIGSEKKKIVGGIEPTYVNCAEAVLHYFGPELKIFMCVRNPRKALYSLFKMNMRDSKETLYYMEKYGKISAEVFAEWVDRECDKETFKYIECVKKYLKYYRRENIKIVIFEELISNPEQMMNELQEYVGVSSNCRVKYDKFLHLNEGSTVPRDLASVYVNQQIFYLVCSQTNVELELAINDLRGRISEITNIEYSEEMNADTAEKLDSYYRDSILELETFIGKSLKGIWY